MSLKDFAVEQTTVEFGKNSLTLQGLSADDVIGLVYENKASVEAVVNLAQTAGLVDGKLPDNASLMAFIGEVAIHFPFVLGALIARGCGEPDLWEKAMTLPLPVQVEAIEHIARLTFVDRAGFERLVGKVKAVLGNAVAPSPPPTTEAG